MIIIPWFLGVVILFPVVCFELVDGIFFISIPNYDSNLRVQSNPFLTWWNLLNRRTTPKPYTSVKTCASCTCGKPNINRRIVGGQETQMNQYPWVGMLYHSNRYYCGLSLINDRYALTASHCVNGFRRESMTVRFLQHNRNIKNSEIIERLNEVLKEVQVLPEHHIILHEWEEHSEKSHLDTLTGEKCYLKISVV